MNNRLGLFGCSLFLLAALAACGGGSSDGGPSAAPPVTTSNSGAGGSAPPSNNTGSAPPPTTTSGLRFAYVAGFAGISAFSVNADDGKLSEIAGSPFGSDTQPSAADVDPSNKFVYSAGNRGVSVYSIDHATGALSEIAGSPFAADDGSFTAVRVHPSGQFVYALAPTSGPGVWAYRVEATGGLVPVAGNPFGPGNLPLDIAIDPSGKYAFVPGCLTNRVYTLRIDSTSGAPDQTGEAIAGTHACGVAVDPSGQFAFVASNGGPGGDGSGVWSFSIDPATGTLTEIGSVTAGHDPNRIAIHPTGQFAYVADFVFGDVSAFRIDAAGTLTSIGAVPGSGQSQSITVDSSGRFAYVTHDDTHTISGYRIDASTGALTEIEGSPLSIGNAPRSMAITGIL